MKDWAGLLRDRMVRPSPWEIVRVNLAVTYRCDSRCTMCQTWRHPSLPQDELRPGEIVDALTSGRLCSQLRTIHITGGEPLIRGDLPALIGALGAAFPRARFDVATNAMNGPRLRSFLENLDERGALGRLHLVVSIDGRAEAHERLRGVEDAFEKTIAGVTEARQRWPSLPVSFSFTLTPLNHEELWPIYRLSTDMGVGFTMRFAASGAFYHNQGAPLQWDPEALHTAVDDVQRLAERIRAATPPVVQDLKLAVPFLRGAAVYAREPRRLFTCYAGVHSLFLDPVGRVYPCLALPQPLGSIRTGSLPEIWFGEAASRIRRSIALERCHCWSECDVMPSLRRGRRLPSSQVRNLD
jgi:radical SAM protein with 4Fe4S-binding SPASM domain